MRITISENEVKAIETQLETILPMVYEVFEVSKDCQDSAAEIIQELVQGFEGEVNHQDPSQGITFEIPEEKTLAYLDVASLYYQLIFKVTKIVKPTVELVVSECKGDFIHLVRKLEDLQR